MRLTECRGFGPDWRNFYRSDGVFQRYALHSLLRRLAYGGLPAPRQRGFPSRIQEKLDAQNFPYKAHNYGVSGETTVGGRQRLPGVLARFEHLSVFVLELGVNDALRGIPVRETVQNLQFMLDEVKRAHPAARRVLVGMEFPFDLGPLATLGGGRMGHYAQEFKALFRQLADKNAVDFVPFLLQGVHGPAPPQPARWRAP